MKIAQQSLFFTFGVMIWMSGCTGNENSTLDESSQKFFVNLLWECAKTEDIGICLKSKAATFLDKLVKMKEPLLITDYLVLARNSQIPEYVDQELSEDKPETLRLLAENKVTNEELDNIIWHKLSALYNTRTLQLMLSSKAFEGRGDKGGKILKKGHGVFLMAAMMGGMMMKMAMGKIALIAGKALIIAKIALVLSLVLFIRRLLTQGAAVGALNSEVVYTTAEHGGKNWERKLKLDQLGSDLAYNAYRPRSS